MSLNGLKIIQNDIFSFLIYNIWKACYHSDVSPLLLMIFSFLFFQLGQFLLQYCLLSIMFVACCDSLCVKSMNNTLKWHYAPLRVNNTCVYAKLKVKVSVYFVTSLFSFILNIAEQNYSMKIKIDLLIVRHLTFKK